MKQKQIRKSRDIGRFSPDFVRHWRLVIIAAIPLGLIALALLGSRPKTTSVMTINGEPLDLREYLLIFNRHRSQVYNEFYLKYGVEDSPGFWTTTYAGETPLDRLKQVTLQEVIAIKVQQLLAREHQVRVALTPQGPFLAADPSYTVFLDNLRRENERRQAALEKGEPIYGPTQFDEDTFYRYVFSKMVEQLQQQLSQGEWAPSDEMLEALYAERKETDYQRGDTIEFESVCWPYVEVEGKMTEASKQESQVKLKEIRTQLERGASFQAVAQLYPVRYAQETLDDSTADLDVKYRPSLTDQVRRLPVGAVSEIFESDEGDALCLITVSGRQAGGYRSFDEVRDQVQARYIEEKYTALIEQLAREAKIEIDEKVYNQIRAG